MRKILQISMLIILPLSLFSQDKVFMPYPEVINMHPDYQYSLTRLFRTYVVQEGRYELITPEAGQGYAPPISPENARVKAKELGAKYYLMAEFNQISDVVISSFTMYETETGTKFWSDMMRALTPDDIDPILSRLALSMGTADKASKKSDIYSVTSYDAMELRQQRSRYNFGVTVGGALPFNANVDKPFGAGTGIIFSYDSRNLIFDIKGEYYWSEADVYNMSLDVLWPLTAASATPFLQGGLGLAGMDVLRMKKDIDWFGNVYEYEDYETNSGLMLFLGAGYILNRTSDVHLRAGGRLFVPTFSVDDRFMPGLMVNLTILFGRK